MVRSYLTLARWLGPWAPADGAPAAVRRDVTVAGPRPFRARLFEPHGRLPRRAFLVAPGLHHAGPDDPRMDRFCAVLAAAGASVLAPAIPDFLALRVTPEAADDFARALDAARFPCRPTLFSISFGSLLALRLAAARPREIQRVVLFGGYADFAAAIRFALSGRGDPLNRPVVFINLVDELGAGEHRDLLVAAWRSFVETTWGRPAMRVDDRWRAEARAIAGALPPGARPLFLAGCGEGSGADCLAALERVDLAHLDPRPHLVSCPVDIVHGIDDDVIPVDQARELARALPRGRLHLTGLYAHTGPSALRPAALARELVTFGRLLRVLASMPR